MQKMKQTEKQRKFCILQLLLFGKISLVSEYFTVKWDFNIQSTSVF